MTERSAIPLLAVAAGVVVTTEFAVVGLMVPLAADLGVSLERAGQLVSVFALAAAILGPMLTLAVGRWLAPRFLALSVLVFGLGNLVAALVPDYAVHLAVRFVQGALLTPFISVASSLAIDLVAPERAGWAVGRVNLGGVVGIVLVVPAVVALADLLGWRPVIVVLGGLTLLLVASLWRLPESTVAPLPWSRQVHVLSRRRFLGHLGLSALLFMAMVTAYSYIVAYLEAATGITGTGVALALLVFGLAGIGGNWWASRRVDAGPTVLTGAVALMLTAVMAALTLLFNWPLAILALLLPWGAAHAAAFVVCQVRVMFAAPEAPAFAASLNIAVGNLGIAAGAGLGAWVVHDFGIAGIGLGAALVGAAALLLAGGLRVSSRPIAGITCQE